MHIIQILDWLEKKGKFTSHDTQIEILKLMALSVLREIAVSLQGTEFHSTVKEFYCCIYYEALDLIVEPIRDRFDQPGYRVYQCLENLLLKAAKQEDFTEELQLAVSTYTSDIHESNLQMQLQTLGSAVHEKVVNIFDVRDYRKKLTPAERLLLNEVTKVMKLILVMPATNAVSEHSFSAESRATYKQQCLKSD